MPNAIRHLLLCIIDKQNTIITKLSFSVIYYIVCQLCANYLVFIFVIIIVSNPPTIKWVQLLFLSYK